MRSHIALIFFSIVFTVYFLASFYVYKRAAHALGNNNWASSFRWIYWSLVASFVMGQLLERFSTNWISQSVTYVGSLWLGLFLYLFLFTLTVDVIRLLDSFLHFIPGNWKSQILTGRRLFFSGLGIGLLLVIIGFINACWPRMHKIELKLAKNAPNRKELKIALVTDIHMGAIVGNLRVSRLVKKLNELKPDLILLGGDLVDHDPLPVYEYKMGELFKDLHPPLGIYAVTGNHEYIGKRDESVRYLSQFGIHYLADEAVLIDNAFWLVGREDREKARFTGTPRKELSEVLKGVDFKLPVILMDHQPREYDKVEAAGIDLMVSGHTHRGQLWPFNYITRVVYELDNGLLIKGGSAFYVSSGYGTWGPPLRLGNRPEIVELKLLFQGNSESR